MRDQPKYAVGIKFKSRGKHPRVCTITDILKTYNVTGELVTIRYVATHECLGQIVTDRDVVQATIDMGLLDKIE